MGGRKKKMCQGSKYPTVADYFYVFCHFAHFRGCLNLRKVLPLPLSHLLRLFHFTVRPWLRTHQDSLLNEFSTWFWPFFFNVWHHLSTIYDSQTANVKAANKHVIFISRYKTKPKRKRKKKKKDTTQTILLPIHAWRNFKLLFRQKNLISGEREKRKGSTLKFGIFSQRT